MALRCKVSTLQEDSRPFQLDDCIAPNVIWVFVSTLQEDSRPFQRSEIYLNPKPKQLVSTLQEDSRPFQRGDEIIAMAMATLFPPSKRIHGRSNTSAGFEDENLAEVSTLQEDSRPFQHGDFRRWL